ncbi:unnamed protein product [Mytilus coruscus]|uniref:COR domain-containing protein n=1 Tax=Mytilus coruscus TaxID=42192 RepID=A0A6J8DCJ7_MYTCO|nr:unnamed protein product [Mytilus coruscus]
MNLVTVRTFHISIFYYYKKTVYIVNNKYIWQDIDTFLSFEIPGLPSEVKKLDKASADVFYGLLEEESYPHFESRVMLAGQQGTGKTTIARYLVGKRPNKTRMSTDGIELYNGLSYMNHETNCWLDGQQDFSMEELTVSRSLLQDVEMTKKSVESQDKALSPQVGFQKDLSMSADEGNLKYETFESYKHNVTSACLDSDNLLLAENFITDLDNVKTKSGHRFETEQVDAGHRVEDINKHLSGNFSEHLSSSADDRKRSDCLRNRKTRSVQGLPIKTDKKYGNYHLIYKRHSLIDVSSDSYMQSGVNDEMHIESITKPGVIRKLKNIFGVTENVNEVKLSITKEKFLQKSVKVGKKQLHNRNIASIVIWDFGGQDVFYSTHQTFLTYRAIYIIVMDGSRKLDDPCPYEQYLPGKSGPKTANDYLRFWINTIVTYCTGNITGFPKIMIILSHKDQLKPNEVEKTRQDLFEEIKHIYGQTSYMQHLLIEDKIFVNAEDKNDPEMAKIKDIIIRESKKQPSWGELLPKCFIPLELEFSLLIKRNISLITLEDLKKINSQQPIRPLTDTELKVFLKFQHSVGKVLYFDEHKLDSHVILSPTILIDAFKSIVTDRRFCVGDRKREELWKIMDKKGVVSKKGIQEIWKKKKYVKFFQDKDYLLDVMTHLDILVEPKRYNSDQNRIPADFYYVASMVQAKDDSGYLQSGGFTQRNIAIAFHSSSLMIPPALSFRFISYCLNVWAVKQYGQNNNDMLFHRSVVFTVDPSLDMYILCEDDRIVVRLVHARTNALIMRDLASSIKECLSSALENISQLYIRSSGDHSVMSPASFISSSCCSSPNNTCILKVTDVDSIGHSWICPKHEIEHSKHIIKSWIAKQDEDKCEQDCPVTNEDFLKESPSDLHLRRLSLLYNKNEIRELAIYLGLSYTAWENVCIKESQSDEPDKLSFEILRKCRDKFSLTFKNIRDATEKGQIQNPHIICKVVAGAFIDVDEKWDMLPTEKHIDRLAPLVGNNSLPFLIELGLDFQTWEQIRHRQTELDLVRLNKDILEEWRREFCRMHGLKPTLRKVAQAFSNIGKHIKMVENTLSDLF